MADYVLPLSLTGVVGSNPTCPAAPSQPPVPVIFNEIRIEALGLGKF